MALSCFVVSDRVQPLDELTIRLGRKRTLPRRGAMGAGVMNLHETGSEGSLRAPVVAEECVVRVPFFSFCVYGEARC
jgi:hypothetical protein